jgi:hypothetical protein
MARRKPPAKSKLHKQLGESRKSQVPKKGVRVEYPVPFPPVSHVRKTKDGPLHEIAVPTGEEQWFPAKVLEIQHFENTVDPADYLALLEPDEGIPFACSVVLLRKPE